MTSPTRWAWVWVNSESLWWTGRPGLLRFMGSQRVGHNWATELNWTHLFPRSASYHAFRKTEESKFQWMVNLAVKTVFLGYLLQGLPYLVPPSLQAYPTDGLFLKHPSFSTLNPERKPGGLPALLCLCLPVREEERQWYNKGRNICFHTHTHTQRW